MNLIQQLENSEAAVMPQNNRYKTILKMLWNMEKFQEEENEKKKHYMWNTKEKNI